MKQMCHYKKALGAIVALAAAGLTSHAAITVTSGSYNYSQNFDTLATSGTTVAWANDSTVAGWSLFTKDNAAITSYAAGNGSGNTGSYYSYGSTSDRALGGLGSGGAYFGSPASAAVAGWIAVAFQNNSGSTLSGFTASFNGEQWRNGGNPSGQDMILEYGFGSSFATVGSWTAPGGNFNWTSPVIGSTAAAVDGNAAGLVAGRGGSINNLSWNSGDTLWIRWVEKNDVGNDHGLAIDDFQFSSLGAVPEPAAWGSLAGLSLVACFVFTNRVRGKKTTAVV